MKIALIGYGKMGKTIEKMAIEQGHEIVLKFDFDKIRMATKDRGEDLEDCLDFEEEEAEDEKLGSLQSAKSTSGNTGNVTKTESIEPDGGLATVSSTTSSSYQSSGKSVFISLLLYQG